MSGTTQDAELAHYKTLPAEPILKSLGFKEYTHTQHEGKNVKLREIGYEKGAVRAHPFFGRDGQWMCRFPKSGSIDKPYGSIVDVAYAMTGNLGKARQLLRDATGYTPTGTSFPVSPPSTISTTTAQEKTALAETAPAIPSSSRQPVSPPAPAIQPADPLPTPAELEALYEARGPLWTLVDPAPQYLRQRYLGALHPVFHGTFRVSTGRHNSVVFPYIRRSDDEWEFAGAEVKNHGWKGYDKGGRAGIWTATFDYPRSLVVTESPIDAMSYARLMIGYEDLSVGFIAVRSGGEQSAIDYIAELIETKDLRIVVLATDNDSAGLLYASKIMAGLHKYSGRISVRYEAPIYAQNDWSDALKYEWNLTHKKATSGSSSGPRPVEAEAPNSEAQPAEKSEETPKSPLEYDPFEAGM